MSDKKYYEIAASASKDFEANNGLRVIKNLAKNAELILDVGCGEGTRIKILNKKAKKYGVDVNKYAIKTAKKEPNGVSFAVYDGIRLPFEDDSFDLVYCAYVLEHTKDPYAVLDEMVRVTKKGGHICAITPNFGSPNRRSPNSLQGKFTKLVDGFIEDFLVPQNLSLQKVQPKKNYTKIDDDTTVEPYLRKMDKYLSQKGFKKELSSLWELDDGRGLFWWLLKNLGQKNIYPFKYWGPQAFVCFQK